MHTKKSEILSFLKNNRHVVFGSFIFGFLSILSTILIPVFLGKFYQLALHTRSTRGKIFDKIFGHINNIEEYFLFFALLIALKLIFDYFQKYYSGICGELFSKEIREKLFAKQLITPLDIHQRKETGMYLLRYSGDLSSVQNYFTKGIIAFLNDCLFLVTAIAIFALINLELTCIVLISFPLIFFSILRLNKKLKKLTKKRRNMRSGNLAFVSSRLNALLTVKIFNRETTESEKFEKRSQELYNIGKRYYKWYSLINALLPFMLYVMLGVLLLFAWQINDLGSVAIDGSVILIFIMLMVNAIPVLKRILRVNLVWQAGDISFRKLLTIFNTSEETKDKTESIKFITGTIIFENVTFGFSKDKKLFNHFSCEIPGNKITLINGLQGSGKSTLLKLIAGIYNCESGNILIDGENIGKFSRHSLRKNVTMVSSELPLIGSTVFETISYSRKEEKRDAALRLLNELGFRLENYESILDYPVFDGGKNLSAGQRKLLMIARALLTKKKIILLDEPFVDLDEDNKLKVVKMILKIKENHTILAVDKDINTLPSDKVIPLDTSKLYLSHISPNS